MKRPTTASRKKVTAENLARLGAERLAELLAGAAESRPDLKRRLRMELAAEEGAGHLAVEIDRRLATLQASRGRLSWRQRPGLVRELDGLRTLIAERLAGLDREGALVRQCQLLGAARQIERRVRDRDGEIPAVFDLAAGDLGALLAVVEPAHAAEVLAQAAPGDPARWGRWLEIALRGAPPELARAVLLRLAGRNDASAAWAPMLRQLADAAGDVDAYRSTFADQALKTPAAAAGLARRLLSAGRVEEAGRVLEAAGPGVGRARAAPDYAWEGALIDYLDRSGQAGAAQAARWASFERTLSVERARAFTSRLSGFDDVEAEERAFAHASRHADFGRALAFLMEWPALPEAARMIQSRQDEIDVPPEQAELWAAKLRIRQPAAALLLLRKAAAAAFRRRDFATCDRLTEEAESLEP